MKVRAKSLIWTFVCILIGVLLFYYVYDQASLIPKNPKHDQNHQSGQELREKKTDRSEKRTTSSTTGSEKEIYTWKENNPTITDDKPETSSRKSVTVTKQKTSKNEAEQPGQTTKIDRVLQKYPALQSAEEHEFPTTENQEPRIPHIIHQSFCNESVPESYRGFIETFTTQNPKWQYRLWTNKSGRKLLDDRHPYLVPMFDLFRTCDDKQFDMIKYAVLYEFGGVFADLDMENLRPLDNATMKYSCIIPIEPFEHAAVHLLANVGQYSFDQFENFRNAPKLNTDIMLCRPKHPFFHMLLTNLNSAFDYYGNRDDVTGSMFVTKSYINYNGIDGKSFGNLSISSDSNSPNFYKGNRTEESNDSVYIPNSQYFFDSVDPEFLDPQGNLKKCFEFDEIKNLFWTAKLACAEFERRKKIRKNRKYTFVVHHWHNSNVYEYAKWVKSLEKTHIQKIVSGCILYE